MSTDTDARCICPGPPGPSSMIKECPVHRPAVELREREAQSKGTKVIVRDQVSLGQSPYDQGRRTCTCGDPHSGRCDVHGLIPQPSAETGEQETQVKETRVAFGQSATPSGIRDRRCICEPGQIRTDCPAGAVLVSQDPKDLVTVPEAAVEPAPSVEIRPDYYGGKDNPYEVFKVIRAWWPEATGPGVFFLGNALKYIRRLGQKDDADEIRDLRKAITYLQNELEAREQARARSDQG